MVVAIQLDLPKHVLFNSRAPTPTPSPSVPSSLHSPPPSSRDGRLTNVNVSSESSSPAILLLARFRRDPLHPLHPHLLLPNSRSGRPLLSLLLNLLVRFRIVPRLPSDAVSCMGSWSRWTDGYRQGRDQLQRREWRVSMVRGSPLDEGKGAQESHGSESFHSS